MIKTGSFDFANTTERSAPLEIWNMGIQLTIAETYDYTPDLIQFSSLLQEYTDSRNLV